MKIKLKNFQCNSFPFIMRELAHKAPTIGLLSQLTKDQRPGSALWWQRIWSNKFHHKFTGTTNLEHTCLPRTSSLLTTYCMCLICDHCGLHLPITIVFLPFFAEQTGMKSIPCQGFTHLLQDYYCSLQLCVTPDNSQHETYLPWLVTFGLRSESANWWLFSSQHDSHTPSSALLPHAATVVVGFPVYEEKKTYSSTDQNR